MDKQQNLLRKDISKQNIVTPRNTYHKKYRDSTRDKAFSILGKKCVRCGEVDPIVLSIDHIKPIGKNRKLLTYSIHLAIIRNPLKSKQKYQLLCRNCNWKKMVIDNERNANQAPMDPNIQQILWMVTANTEAIRQLKKKKVKSTKLSIMQIEELLLPHYKLFINGEGKIDKELMRIVAEEELGIYISSNRGYNIAKRLVYHNPKVFVRESTKPPKT